MLRRQSRRESTNRISYWKPLFELQFRFPIIYSELSGHDSNFANLEDHVPWRWPGGMPDVSCVTPIVYKDTCADSGLRLPQQLAPAVECGVPSHKTTRGPDRSALALIRALGGGLAPFSPARITMSSIIGAS